MRKLAIVTGASSGVGYSVCELLQEKGYMVVALSRTDKKILRLIEKDDSLEHYCVDLIDYGETKKIFALIEEKYEKIDLVVNCAASFESTKFVHQNIDNINKIIDTNIKTYVNVIKLSLPSMISAKNGLIINIASVSGKYGIENQAVYSCTKHALSGLAGALAKEMFGKNIKITTLYPGGIDTELWNENNPYLGSTEDLIKPAEIAEIIYFVCQLPANIVMKEMTFFPRNELH